MKRTILITACLAGILALTAVSCSKEVTVAESANDGDAALFLNPKLRSADKKKNPYSLEIMQAALDSLLKTKTGVGGMLRPTDYYFRFNSLDTISLQVAQAMPFMEVFDYPLDVDFEEETEYYYDPDEPTDTSVIAWNYSALSTQRALEQISYEDFLLAQAEGRTLSVRFLSDSGSVFTGELLDECYIPDHDPGTRAGNNLGVSPEELEKMAFEIAGVEYEFPETKASESYPSGYVYLKNDGTLEGVKGVKVRAQRLLKWSTGYTDASGHFSLSKRFSRPNISIIYSNQKHFSIWGNWAFLAPATYTVTKCSNPASFTKTFYRNAEFSPWSWAVVNNAAYDYYTNCTQTNPRTFNGVSLPPIKLNIWCINGSSGYGEGSSPMIKHMLSWGTLFSAATIVALLAKFNIFTTLYVALKIKLFGPDIILMTYNKSYNELYALTFHELSHASHYSVTGRSNYAKLILYELSYALSDDYGPGGTGSEGEGLCELSETYAYSIQNYINRTMFGITNLVGTNEAYCFFHKYTLTLSAILCDGILTPGQVFTCITSSTGNMDTLLDDLCAAYTAKSTALENIMSSYGL